MASIVELELACPLERVGQHDEVECRQFYELPSREVFGLALHIVRQQRAAEDVLQESFVSVWRTAGNYRD
ncbi:MAG: hypothetical protein EON56_01245 [Alphaproteobacteria bacterium]|nr:MAG: hypothetical protein EON56_01245 [Alphaproteobacteria bacterium]